MEAMASELCKEYIAKNDELANKNDMTALFRIGYGLYVVTSNDGKKDNGLIFLDKYINVFMSLKVEQYVDLGTHGMFICSVTEARVVSDQETMSYTYYQKNVKPKPETEGKKGFVCKVCGYIYEGDELPEDYICPLCKHGAVDFEPIG